MPLYCVVPEDYPTSFGGRLLNEQAPNPGIGYKTVAVEVLTVEEYAEIHAEVERLTEELTTTHRQLTDAIDCKSGSGPTAMMMLWVDRDTWKAEALAARELLHPNGFAKPKIEQELAERRAYAAARSATENTP